MSLTLLGALTDTFQADGALALAMPGSPWLDEPKEGTPFPFCVLENVREDEALEDFEGGKEVESRWDFVVFQAGTADAESKSALVAAVFDNNHKKPLPMAITGRALVRAILVKYQAKLDRTRSTAAQRVTETRLSFSAEWRKG